MNSWKTYVIGIGDSNIDIIADYIDCSKSGIDVFNNFGETFITTIAMHEIEYIKFPGASTGDRTKFWVNPAFK